MNARVAIDEIRVPCSATDELMVGQHRAGTLPISILTDSLRMDLIQSGKVFGATCAGLYHPAYEDAATDAGWMWVAFTNRGDPLGFIALNSSPASRQFDGYFGPHLDLASRRDRLHASYMPELITGLLDWLRAHDICFVVHADHARTDQHLADWLVKAGFLYTGCRSGDGRPQMICLL